MNIALVGKFSHSWGAEGHVQRALLALGHEVYGLSIAPPDPPAPQWVETEAEAHALVARYEAAKHPTLDGIRHVDLTLVIQGYGLPLETIARCRERTGAPVILWHGEVLGDHWPTDDEVVQAKVAQLVQNIAAYDLVCHNCRTSLPVLTQLGARRVACVPISAVDPTVHRRLDDVPRSIDLGIFGWASNRRYSLVKEVIEQVQALRGEDQPPLTYAWPDPAGTCYGETLNRFLNACRVCLNVHFSETLNVETRIFESLGAGTPVVSEPLSMPELFPEGLGVCYGETPEQLAAAVETILRLDPVAYGNLADAGHQLVHTQHTYQSRCETLLKIIAEALG